MQVVKLLHELGLAPDIVSAGSKYSPHPKIIEASLPEAAERIVAARKWQTKLSGGVAVLAAQASRDALLQDLNHGGRRAFGQLSDQ